VAPPHSAVFPRRPVIYDTSRITGALPTPSLTQSGRRTVPHIIRVLRPGRGEGGGEGERKSRDLLGHRIHPFTLPQPASPSHTSAVQTLDSLTLGHSPPRTHRLGNTHIHPSNRWPRPASVRGQSTASPPSINSESEDEMEVNPPPSYDATGEDKVSTTTPFCPYLSEHLHCHQPILGRESRSLIVSALRWSEQTRPAKTGQYSSTHVISDRAGKW